MKQKPHPHRSGLVRIAAQWRALACLLVAFARKASAMQYTGAGDAWAAADTLELWVRCALIPLNRQIAAAQARESELSKAERAALQHMQAIALSLLTLAVLAQHYKTCGPRGGVLAAWRQGPGSACPKNSASTAITHRCASAEIPFLDSG